MGSFQSLVVGEWEREWKLHDSFIFVGAKVSGSASGLVVALVVGVLV